MAISAEQLNIILSAQDKALTKALDRSTKNVNRFAKKSQQNLSRTSKSFDSLGKAAKRLAPIIAAAVSVGAAKNAITLGKEIGDLARIAGVGAEEFQELAFAARTVGISQEKLSDIFKDMNDRVSDFIQTGGGPMKDFFEQVAPLVGVTAEQFKNLSGPDALQLYVNTLQKAGANQQDFTFYLEAMASDATALVPLLKDNAAGFKELGKEARDAGAIMSADTIKAAGEMDKKLQTLSATISTKFLTQLGHSEEALERIVKFITETAIPAFGNFIDSVGGILELADELGVNLNPDVVFELDPNDNINRIVEKLAALRTEIEAIESRGENMTVGDAAQLENLTATLNNLEARRVELTQGDPLRPGTIRPDDQEPGIVPANTKIGDTSATDATRDQMRAYEDLVRSLNPAVDATIAYAEQLHIINAELDSGRISQDQSNALIDQARQKMQEARREASKFASVFETVESSIESSMMGLVNGTMNVKDAFKSMAAQVVSELYRVLVVQRMVNAATSAMGGGTGGFLSSMLMGTRAGGGSVQAGNAYMTGESGRELFVPAQNGRILSPAQTRMVGGGEAVTVVQNINISTGVQQTVRAEIKGMMPAIADNAKAAVLDAKRRGGSYGRAMA
tara:strand:- start:564 stop:2435 length:1872 start_codon:yes stop_codon:yes gene_type:complete